MESLVNFQNLRGKKVFITGHSGFKGRWLCQLLASLSCDIHGVSKDDGHKETFEKLGIRVDSRWFDIKSYSMVQRAILDVEPDYIFHFAAQALVGDSYADPLETIETNVMGSTNILEVLRTSNLQTHLIYITTDKVYKNNEWIWGYRENEPLGGKDLYSSSKAAADLIAQSYISSFVNKSSKYSISICRAGNVIGGGDCAENRIVPDIFKSIESREVLQVRRPQSRRPWQHVLDCLGGYLTLADQLQDNPHLLNQSWNFGPDSENNRTVLDLVEKFRSNVPELEYVISEHHAFEEAKYLYLDSSKAKRLLGWKPVFSFDDTVDLTSFWSRQNPGYSQAMIMEYQTNEYLSRIKPSGTA